MKHTTLYNTVAKSPCAYCRRKGVSLTVKQVKSKECLKKGCHYLVKYEAHEWWHQRELKKQRKKAKKHFDELMMY